MKMKLPIIIGGIAVVIVFGALVFILALNGKAASKQNLQDLSQTVAKAVAPDFNVKDIFGNEDVSLKKYAGKVVLLNFWATWCPPCKLEIPDLIVLQEQYKDKFVIIGVSVDQDGPEGVKAFYQANKMNYPVIMATADMIASYGGITAIPTSFIINGKGEAVTKIVGYRSKDQYEELIKQNF